MSTNLSIVALIGLVLVPMVPDRAASTASGRTAQPGTPPAAISAPAAPVEMVRAKTVLVPQVPTAKPTATRGPTNVDPTGAGTDMPELMGGADPETHRAAAVLAKLSRERKSQNKRQRTQPESGEAGKGAERMEAGEQGKAGDKTANATRIPVAPPSAQSDAAKSEPPVPDEWSDTEIIAALRDCLKRLAPLGAEIEIAPPMKQDQCGNAAPVLLKRIGQGANRVEFQPPPTVNCAMVASLHTWVEKTLQPAAQETLGSGIVRVRGASGYSCRNRNGVRAPSDRLSEHAHANAIDIMGFVTADGRTIDVLDRWGPTERDIREEQARLAEARAAALRAAREAADLAADTAREAEKAAAEAARAVAKAPAAKRNEAKAEASRKKEEAQRKREEADAKAAEARQGRIRTAEMQKLGRGVDAIPTTAKGARHTVEATFLRRLHKGACSAFGTVLGPEANEAHRNHFHFDLAPRKRSNYCE